MGETPVLPCASWQALMQELATVRDEASLVRLAGQGQTLCRQMLEEGAGARLGGRLMSALSDAVTRAALELVAGRHALPHVAWCWLAFGSEGREEQTLVTDQDNGLVFATADARETEVLQARFLPFARDVNGLLDRCGYTLCKGNVMASNPDCCLSLEQWQEAFHQWLRLPEPEALLKATIYFDLRAVAGDGGLCEQLRQFIAAHVSQAPAFLHLLSENAKGVPPPLGMLGELHFEQNSLDLKTYGTRLFVDGARILALATGVDAVDTLTRLQKGGARAGLDAREVTGSCWAFLHLQERRLQQQMAALGAGLVPDNLLHPEHLAELDQALLKAVFRQARMLQHSYGQRYGFTH